MFGNWQHKTQQLKLLKWWIENIAGSVHLITGVLNIKGTANWGNRLSIVVDINVFLLFWYNIHIGTTVLQLFLLAYKYFIVAMWKRMCCNRLQSDKNPAIQRNKETVSSKRKTNGKRMAPCGIISLLQYIDTKTMLW